MTLAVIFSAVRRCFAIFIRQSFCTVEYKLDIASSSFCSGVGVEAKPNLPNTAHVLSVSTTKQQKQKEKWKEKQKEKQKKRRKSKLNGWKGNGELMAGVRC